ncbi:ferrochelatase [Frateuria sp.]|uniref:ferrochelatase n=1 Tax=Frateuria sp. TaxID=2211372 RepID=UPI003F7F2160
MPQRDHYTGPSDHAPDRNVQAGARATGVLLVNLGTPEAPTARALRPYLAQFLSDRRVIDYPRWKWWPILQVILAIRPRRSAHAYARIWTEAGSPLRVLSEALATALQAELGEQARVALAMRYGAPSAAGTIAELQAAGVRRLLVLPLYPQYSATSTGSVIDAVADALKRLRWPPELRLVNDYHDDPTHIEALAARIERWWEANGRGEKLLLSFHGIPERYVRLGDPYLAQCQATAARLRARLGLDESRLLLSFQSRVGRETWLQPYTDATVRRLAEEGVTRLDVACPGFAVDCLETLEEIAMQNRDFFLEAGGQDLRYIPALNDSPEQVASLAAIVRRQAQGWPGFP